uniref:XK-related protein n=1 Tax=Angiostrongylus cantonensis TaxID=6313 RepID=A0A0K0D7B1_ANGCA
MGCAFRARLNQICSIWYTVLILCIQSYLLYLGFERYKLYTEMKWPTGGYPHVWLTIYITLYAVCIPLSLLFFSFGFFKSGNIAGDNEKLADREDRVIELSANRRGQKSGCLHTVKSCWQHSPPMPQQIHVVTALCQLVAQQFMIAQFCRHGFVN